MTGADFESIAELSAKNLYLQVHIDESPDIAARSLVLLTHVRALHRELAPEHFASGVEVRLSLDNAPAASAGSDTYFKFGELLSLLSVPRPGLIVTILEDERFELEFGEVSDASLPDTIKYILVPGSEELLVTPSANFEIGNGDPHESPFAITYFRSLAKALAEYHALRARKSACEHLLKIWAGKRRIVLSNRPEAHMRRSLHSYLQARLRDADPVVLQEQETDETKPVDIRIQWVGTKRISLLEVKWLGSSLNSRGSGLTTPWGDARAREGYTQTFDYLERQRGTLADHIVHATLVVFDARRKNPSWTAPSTESCSDGWYFEVAAVDYRSVWSSDPGMEPPVRFFLEPLVPRAA